MKSEPIIADISPGGGISSSVASPGAEGGG